MNNPITLYSSVLDESRQYRVYLPEGYDDTLYAPVSYPVVYLLDGERYGSLVSELLTHLGRSYTAPRVILVAIDTSQNRVRDLTPTHSLLDWLGQETLMFSDSGGLNYFLDFIDTELIPQIEADYRTASHRSLIGHSLGGLAVTYSLVTRPTLFQGNVSIDGSLWWDQQMLVTLAASAEEGQPDRQSKRRFYSVIAKHQQGGPNDLSQLVEGNNHFIDTLGSGSPLELSVEHQILENETHISVVLPGVLAGLRYLFQGHRLPFGWAPDVQTVIDHYQTFSHSLGFPYQPPEQLLDTLAWQPFPKLDRETCAELLKLNLANYPGSSHAHSSLGKWYQQAGDNTAMKVLFEQALMLNAENRDAISCD